MIKDQQIREWYYRHRGRHDNEIMKILGVEYVHLFMPDGEDLYITKYGLPFFELLNPENYWTDEEWFDEHSIRLDGTSNVYMISTKKVNGKSRNIVVKWNRMGQDIPGGNNVDILVCAEFNSPFEEFSLVMELKEEMEKDSSGLLVQTPLAIYVPAESSELWKLGRRESKIQTKVESHSEIELDMHKSYAVIYDWIDGIDVKTAGHKKIIPNNTVWELSEKVHGDVHQKGYLVKDEKPQHVILQSFKNGKLKKKKDGSSYYGIVDFELLARTPEKEKESRRHKRADYHLRQKDRFATSVSKKLHPHLKHVKIMGVDYIYGNVESTKGRLWVVGKDPFLFDYFLPERWEQTPRTKISIRSEMYYTVTKDEIHLVWKVSKMGIKPDVDPFNKDEKLVFDHGYNSPFEEVALAVDLDRGGLPTIYPRAIYMSQTCTMIPEYLFDNSRYESHKSIRTPDRKSILQQENDYVVIWGYWNGPDEKLAGSDGDFFEGKNALRAYREGLITQKDYLNLMKRTKSKLQKLGVSDLNLRGNHIMISIDSKGNFVRDSRGKLELRICNFEFLKR